MYCFYMIFQRNKYVCSFYLSVFYKKIRINSLPNDKLLDLSKLKAFADE